MNHIDAASIQFVFFVLAVAIVSNFSRSRIWRSFVLLLASLLFIALIERNALALLPMASFLALGYVCLLLLRCGRSRVLPLILTATILFYCWLKRYAFLPHSIFLQSPYFTLGLSYIFFRVLHLLIEAGDNAELRRIGLIKYALYTLNFTTFVSGPIQRYDDFARDQFASEPLPLGASEVALQLERIIRGIFKVNVLATLLNAFQQDTLAQTNLAFPLSLRMYAAACLIVTYPLFLYSNFSGYIDIVIALARLMRLQLPENFNRPFSTTSPLDFWNQWHMTLSNWFKTYVYNPLVLFLMRRVTSRSFEPFIGVLCFFVTFFLVGIWHGRTSEFIFFGLLTGGGVSVAKLWQITLVRRLGRKGARELAKNEFLNTINRGLSFVWFGFTLFWFWGDWKRISSVVASLNAMEWALPLLGAWMAVTVVLGIWEWLRSRLISFRTADSPVFTNRYARVIYASAMGLATILITLSLNQAAPEIVYKAF
jgi:D-alanyl-lipoteichoic acid acyltransferase DltB (MBOAT superfamily)